jgi:hypothetical protein
MIGVGDWKLVNASGFTELPSGEKPRMQMELYDLATDPYEEHDVAADHPEIVARLKEAYAAWYTDVGGDNPENYAPPRISIGHPNAPRTVLTRQDWRGAGWGDRARGHWLLDVVEPGTYRVTIRPCIGKRWPTAEHITLKVGNTTIDSEYAPDATELVLPKVTLLRGPTQLKVDVRDEKGVIGAYQVVIEPKNNESDRLDQTP